MELKYLAPEVSDSTEVLHMKLWEGTANDYTGNYTGTLSGTATAVPERGSQGLAFVAANAEYIDIGTGPTSVKTVSLWINQDDVAGNEYPIDLDGASYLSVESGVVTVNGFTAATLYVNGAAGTSGVTTITAGTWFLITITDTTAVDAADLDIGRVTAAYYDGLISDVRLYSVVRTAIQVKDFFEKTRWRYGV